VDEVRPLDGRHERAGFSCGDPKLDDYLRSYAGQSMERRTEVVWVWTRPPSQAVVGYYTLTNTQIEAGALPEEVVRRFKLRNPPTLGATLLGRFAVDSRYQGQGLGRMLCLHALEKSLAASKVVASVGVVLDAYSEGARAFWRRMEFVPLGERAGGMERFFLPMGYVGELLG
jgi:GNAT superfamily N-acetyltransferase